MQELGTALGYLVLLAGAVARMLQAPLLHHFAYGGSTTHLVPLHPQADVFALPSSTAVVTSTPLFIPPGASAPAEQPELCALARLFASVLSAPGLHAQGQLLPLALCACA